MKHGWLRSLYHWAYQFGWDGLRWLQALRGLPAFLANRSRFKRLWKQKPSPFRWGSLRPCPADRFAASGEARGHYFHQDLWASQRLFTHHPTKHVDAGSRVDGFVAHAASFRELEILDLRPQPQPWPRNLRFRQQDLTQKPWPLPGYCDSVSCLSVLEHLGLGRYGDRVDPDAYLVGWENLHALLQPGGRLYFSVPIGPGRVEFDAHRVFDLGYLLPLIEEKYRIEALAYVNDQGDLVEPAARDTKAESANFGCTFGCGLFVLNKR
jgi:hypothetical protein